MRIGAIGSYGFGNFNNYRVSGVYGNPGSLQPVKKVGQENASGNTLAVLKKEKGDNRQEENTRPVQQQQSAVRDYQNIMEQMRTMTRFSADTIPMASAI